MTSSIPEPLRAVAGLAAMAIDETRGLPDKLTSLPVVAIGAAMQASLRIRQSYAGLVARGDELLTQFGAGSDEAPSWARFDDDETGRTADSDDMSGRDDSADSGLDEKSDIADVSEMTGISEMTDTSEMTDIAGMPDAADRVDPAEPIDPSGPTATRNGDVPEQAVGNRRSRFDAQPDPDALAEPPTAVPGAAPVPGYDGFSLPQLRARLRRYDAETLRSLIEHERSGARRPAYITMLENRLATLDRS